MSCDLRHKDRSSRKKHSFKVCESFPTDFVCNTLIHLTLFIDHYFCFVYRPDCLSTEVDEFSWIACWHAVRGRIYLLLEMTLIFLIQLQNNWSSVIWEFVSSSSLEVKAGQSSSGQHQPSSYTQAFARELRHAIKRCQIQCKYSNERPYRSGFFWKLNRTYHSIT